MKRIALWSVSLVALAALVSCGGGGGDAGGAAVVGSPAGASAEGYYAGTLSVTGTALADSSTHFQMLVLENGQFWTIYGTPGGGSLNVEGFAQGAGTSTNPLFIAPAVRYFSRSPATTNALSASYNATLETISGTIADANRTVTFTSAPLAAPAFDYDAAAQLSGVQGNWRVKGVFGDLYDLVVLPGGTFTGTPVAAPVNPATCPFTGSFSPRASGKNLFTVSITNGGVGSGCAVDVQDLDTAGVAYITPLTAGSQLTFATVEGGTPPARGAVLSGVRL